MSEQFYDVQQVCENGHKITGRYRTKPKDQQKFCGECGQKTIIECPNCHKEIQGDKYAGRQLGFVNMVDAVVPSYCRDCGKAYPWTQKKIAAAIEIFAEFGNLDDEEKKTIKEDIENIAKDVPKAELSARRLKRIWKKYGPVCYETIMELASSTAAKILKDP